MIWNRLLMAVMRAVLLVMAVIAGGLLGFCLYALFFLSSPAVQMLVALFCLIVTVFYIINPEAL